MIFNVTLKESKNHKVFTMEGKINNSFDLSVDSFDAIDELGLAEGSHAIAVVKATDVIVAID